MIVISENDGMLLITDVNKIIFLEFRIIGLIISKFSIALTVTAHYFPIVRHDLIMGICNFISLFN